jgi:hypothetical protein
MNQPLMLQKADLVQMVAEEIVGEGRFFQPLIMSPGSLQLN